MTATIIHFSNSRQAAMIQFKARARVVHEAAQQGWVRLNDDEKKLIRLLRSTSYTGRDAVLDAARAVREKQPWIDGKQFRH